MVRRLVLLVQKASSWCAVVTTHTFSMVRARRLELATSFVIGVVRSKTHHLDCDGMSARRTSCKWTYCVVNLDFALPLTKCFD